MVVFHGAGGMKRKRGGVADLVAMFKGAGAKVDIERVPVGQSGSDNS